jgi:alkylation response protein AidB-like acyl-CoA dehydrogenase
VLNIGRLKLGTRNIGSAKQALNRAIEYAVQRHQFGRPIASFGMIRQKLAEMAVRCYVGDAMVYRTLGDADGALERVAPDDSAAVLATIESFAVECSINKVWMSEALAYVVDEALQVYGGYGYSKEYPAERAYRDARITRLYEGTNEINRLIIPTRLRRSRRASPLVLSLLDAASERYGEDLAEQQEVLGHIADVAIESYAIESAELRTQKMPAKHRPLAEDLTRGYTEDATDRIWHSARQLGADVTHLAARTTTRWRRGGESARRC